MRLFLNTGIILAAAINWLATPAAAACNGATLERALLVRGISGREPVGPPVTSVSADDSALYAFTEVTGARGERITHTWFHDNQEAASVTLTIGADRWRTWSSKRLGFRRDDNWRVEIRLADGCLLATLAPGGNQAFSETAARIEALLADGDVTGARMALGEATDRSLLPPATLDELSGRQVPMAQVQALLDEGNLYIARARLQPLLERWPDDDEVAALQSTLADALGERAGQMSATVNALQALLNRLPAGAGPCGSAGAPWWQETLDSEDLQVVERHADTGTLHLLLLDGRSGQTMSMTLPCLQLPIDRRRAPRKGD